MRRYYFCFALIALLSSCISFTISAQTVVIKGVVKEDFRVKEGKISVYLPDDIRPGDMISGTVLAESSGRNEKEKKSVVSVSWLSFSKYKNEIKINLSMVD